MPTFLDEAEIEIKSGNGGNGAVSFRKEPFVPHGGPNGGNGGRGGDVIVIADRSINTLLDYKYQTKFYAENGGNGAGGDKSGKNGEPVILRVPVGTTVYDAETGDKIVDLIAHEQKHVILRGGNGGFGNAYFKSASRQAPRFALKGIPGIKMKLKMELKLIADIGIIGYPNAGKSTFISRVSAAKPKIADYPFTTLEPNLGVVRIGTETFVMADMPGLIEGAHQGFGLGDRFLRHIERARALLHLIDCSDGKQLDPITAYKNINLELERYNKKLEAKPMITALNKADAVADRSELEKWKSELESIGMKTFIISGFTGEGAEPLLYALAEALKNAPPDYDTSDEPLVISPTSNEKPTWSVTAEDEHEYRVKGKIIERIAAMTDLNNEEGLMYLHRKLVKMGVIQSLSEAGCRDGDTVRIADFEFNFTEEQ